VPLEPGPHASSLFFQHPSTRTRWGLAHVASRVETASLASSIQNPHPSSTPISLKLHPLLLVPRRIVSQPRPHNHRLHLLLPRHCLPCAPGKLTASAAAVSRLPCGATVAHSESQPLRRAEVLTHVQPSDAPIVLLLLRRSSCTASQVRILCPPLYPSPFCDVTA
jgi:hypothetical protein